MIFAPSLIAVFIGAGLWQPLPRAAHGISDRMTSLEVTENGAGEDEYLWVGTEGGELRRYDLRTDRWFSLPAPPANPGAILDIGYDDRFLWVGAAGGIFRFDRRADRWLERSDTLVGQGPIVARMGIDKEHMKSGPEGLSSNRYVWFLSPQVSQPTSLLSVRSSAGISILDQWYDKMIPIALAGGLSELNPQDAILEGDLLRIAGTSGLHSLSLTAQNSLSTSAFLAGGSSQLHALAVDGDRLWAGGRGEIYLLEKASNGRDRVIEHYLITESPEGRIRRILVTANVVVFGTENDGAYAWDRATDRWGRVPAEFVARRVDDLAATSDGFMVSSTEGGLQSKLVRYWGNAPGGGPAARERTVLSAIVGNVAVSSQYLISQEKPLVQIIDSISVDALLSRLAAKFQEPPDAPGSVEAERLSPEVRDLLARFQTYRERTVTASDPAAVSVVLESGKTIMTVPSGLVELRGMENVTHGGAIEARTFEWTICRAVFGTDGVLEELE